MTIQHNRLMIALSLVAILALSASPAMAKKGAADHAKSHGSVTHVASAHGSKGAGGGLDGLATALGMFNGLVGGMRR